DGKELRLLSYPGKVLWVSFGPDGSRLYAAGRTGIKVWETQTGLEVKHFLDEATFYPLEWLPDGQTLAGTTGGRVWHMDPESGKVVNKQDYRSRSLWDHQDILTHLLSPGARFLCLNAESGFLLTQVGSDPERRRMFRLGPSR